MAHRIKPTFFFIEFKAPFVLVLANTSTFMRGLFSLMHAAFWLLSQSFLNTACSLILLLFPLEGPASLFAWWAAQPSRDTQGLPLVIFSMSPAFSPYFISLLWSWPHGLRVVKFFVASKNRELFEAGECGLLQCLRVRFGFLVSGCATVRKW